MWSEGNSGTGIQRVVGRLDVEPTRADCDVRLSLYAEDVSVSTVGERGCGERMAYVTRRYGTGVCMRQV